MRNSLAVSGAALLLSCAPRAPVPLPAGSGPASVRALGNVSADFWEELVRHAPVWATSLGDRSRDGQMDDPSDAENRRHLAALRALQDRASGIDRAPLTPAQKITAAFLDEELAARLGLAVCAGWLWQVDALGGPQVAFMQLSGKQTIRSAQDVTDLADRYRAMGPYFDAHVKALRTGLATGYVAPKSIVVRVLEQLDTQLAMPLPQTPFLEPVRFPAEWPASQQAQAKRDLLEAAEAGVRPGLEAYRTFLRSELLPLAREKSGVREIPDGDACYAARIRSETGTTRSPKEIHALGVERLSAIEREMDAIRTRKKQETQPQPTVHSAKTAAEIVAHNEMLIERARTALPKAFGRVPAIPLEVRAVEPFREKDASRGQYHNAPADGSRPAIYYVNTYQPPKHPLHEMAALAFHEALPGHHLQVGIAGELKGVPRFQMELGSNAFVEGWALYSERLADELGLYRNDAERIGMLDAQRIRAVRLVVDTGIHGLGMTRAEAIAFQRAHTEGDLASAERAIDRYIGWPGQALGYMVGQIEIESMRAGAATKKGAGFDLKAFHDRLLSNGGVPLPVARQDIEAWAEGR